MNHKQAFLYIFLYVAIIALGLYIGIIIAGSYNGRLVSSCAFIMVSFGVMGLSISLARIFVRANTDFGMTTLFSGRQYKQFRQAVGKGLSLIHI